MMAEKDTNDDDTGCLIKAREPNLPLLTAREK